MARIGIVGIGNMGLGMALRLLDHGHSVRVRRSRARLTTVAPHLPPAVSPRGRRPPQSAR